MYISHWDVDSVDSALIQLSRHAWSHDEAQALRFIFTINAISFYGDTRNDSGALVSRALDCG